MGRVVPRLLMVTLIAVLALPGCRRQPTEPPPPPPTPTETPPEPPPVDPLVLPMTNRQMGITLSSLPDPLVAAYNEGPEVMLVDRDQRFSRVFFETLPQAGPLVPEVYFEEARIAAEGFGGGRQVETGTIEDTPLGRAAWSTSRFWMDGRYWEQVELVAPHPAGRGRLVLRASFPEGSEKIPAKLAELEDLLGRITAAGGS